MDALTLIQERISAVKNARSMVLDALLITDWVLDESARQKLIAAYYTLTDEMQQLDKKFTEIENKQMT